MRPETGCKRNRIVTVAIKMFDQLLISDDSCLLEPIHAFVDLNIDIAIRINEGIDHVECSDFWRKVLGMNAHILGTCHRCGREKSFKSIIMKRAPRWASEMVLLSRSFVSNKDVVGEEVSWGQSNRSPPNVRRIR